MFKKKILVLLSSLMLVSTFGTSVFADEPDVQDTNLSYEVTEGYEWSVPDSIDFTSESFEGISATGNDSQVKITKAVITAGKKLVISLDDENDLKLSETTGHELAYQVFADNSELSIGGEVLSLNAGESCDNAQIDITATLTKDANEIAGDYSDTLIFVAEIKDAVELLSLGGKVFLDNGDNGATYTFYDVDGNEITYSDLSSLDNAVYYTVEGTPTSDRFYVVASDSSQADYNSTYGVNLGTSKYWGYYNISTGATTNAIGSGKTNTDKVLAIEDTSEYNAAHGKPNQSIWEWLNDVNSNEYGDCSDWFIGSQAEYDALRTSGKAGTLFDSKNLWSSVERESDRAYYWYYYDSRWDDNSKSVSLLVVAFRAF